MTSLEDFLNKENKNVEITGELVTGSFSCQDIDCSESVSEAYMNSERNRVLWVCANKHRSSVSI